MLLDTQSISDSEFEYIRKVYYFSVIGPWIVFIKCYFVIIFIICRTHRSSNNSKLFQDVFLSGFDRNRTKSFNSGGKSVLLFALTLANFSCKKTIHFSCHFLLVSIVVNSILYVVLPDS